MEKLLHDSRHCILAHFSLGVASLCRHHPRPVLFSQPPPEITHRGLTYSKLLNLGRDFWRKATQWSLFDPWCLGSGRLQRGYRPTLFNGSAKICEKPVNIQCPFLLGQCLPPSSRGNLARLRMGHWLKSPPTMIRKRVFVSTLQDLYNIFYLV